MPFGYAASAVLTFLKSKIIVTAIIGWEVGVHAVGPGNCSCILSCILFAQGRLIIVHNVVITCKLFKVVFLIYRVNVLWNH